MFFIIVTYIIFIFFFGSNELRDIMDISQFICLATSTVNVLIGHNSYWMRIKSYCFDEIRNAKTELIRLLKFKVVTRI